MLELLHNFLEAPRWEESAMKRAKQMYLSHFKSLSKSLERATADRILKSMFSPIKCAPDLNFAPRVCSSAGAPSLLRVFIRS